MGEAKRRREAIRAGRPNPGSSAPNPTSRGQRTYQLRRVGEEIEILVGSQWRRLHRDSDVYKSADAQLRVYEDQQRQAHQVHPSDVVVADKEVSDG